MLRIVNAVAARRRRCIALRLAVSSVILLTTFVAADAQPQTQRFMSPPPVPPTVADGSMIFSDHNSSPLSAPPPGAPDGYMLNSDTGEPVEPGAMMSPGPSTEFGGPDGNADGGEWGPAVCPPNNYCSWLTRLGFRHSFTHGRNVGWGYPLVGSSWLNRPIYAGIELGPIWMTRGPQADVRPEGDLLGGIFLGYDWDYYWGSEFQYEYATPNLTNPNSPTPNRSHRLVTWNYSLMYYPFGDSALRPYWRFGAGDTKFDVPQDDGTREDEWMLTFPVGIGLQYPIQRWLAAQSEFTDNYCIGANGFNSQHLLTWTFALEWRYGFHRESYWPWNPTYNLW